MSKLVCPKCKSEIQLGVAINPLGKWGERQGISPSHFPLTVNNIELISVYKCTSCGYSCDDERDLLEVK